MDEKKLTIQKAKLGDLCDINLGSELEDFDIEKDEYGVPIDNEYPSIDRNLDYYENSKYGNVDSDTIICCASISSYECNEENTSIGDVIITDQKSSIEYNCISIKIKKNKIKHINPKYLYEYLKYNKHLLTNKVKMDRDDNLYYYKIKKEDLREIQICYPSVEKQENYFDKIKQINIEIEKLNKEFNKKIQKLKAEKKQLLAEINK